MATTAGRVSTSMQIQAREILLLTWLAAPLAREDALVSENLMGGRTTWTTVTTCMRELLSASLAVLVQAPSKSGRSSCVAGW